MTPEQFCYWLQGFTELVDCSAPNQHQWMVVCNRLNEVLNKPEKKKVRLGEAHRSFSPDLT